MRPFIGDVIEKLVARHGTTLRVDLNDIAEVIGDQPVSYDEVDGLILELEERGCQVGGEPSVREMALLREVVVAARELEAKLGRRPKLEEIAMAIDHPPFVVRRAVENGDQLGRSRGD